MMPDTTPQPTMRRKPPAAGRGRKKGEVNRITRSAREAFLFAFNGLGGAHGLLQWAQASKANRADFYKMFARLIPVEVVGEGGSGPIQAIVRHVYEDRAPVVEGEAREVPALPAAVGGGVEHG